MSRVKKFSESYDLLYELSFNVHCIRLDWKFCDFRENKEILVVTLGIREFLTLLYVCDQLFYDLFVEDYLKGTELRQ